MYNYIENGPRGHEVLRIEDILLSDKREIFISEEINAKTADAIIKQLLMLEQKDSKKPITIYINSPGGHVESGFAILDIIELIECPVITICTGCAASMAALIFLSGADGHRLMLPHSKLMIHGPSFGGFDVAGMKVHEIEERIESLTETLNETAKLISAKTGKPLRAVKKDLEKDTYLTPKEAIQYGLATEVITKGNFRKERDINDTRK